MKILIIEDEPLVAKDICNLLLRLEPDATILQIVSSVEQCRKWLQKNEQVDLILADIQLSDGISFEIFENVKIECPIIFTTAYDDYAIRAFKLNSVDYLLKPIDQDELQAALKKFRSVVHSDLLEEQLKTLFLQWGKSNKLYKERFLGLHGNSLVPISQSEVAYFHKEQIIYIHKMNNEKFICEFHALDDIESLLDPVLFFRVNRQFIVHAQAVGKIKTTHKGLTVILKSPMNIEIDMSREKATAFKLWLG